MSTFQQSEGSWGVYLGHWCNVENNFPSPKQSSSENYMTSDDGLLPKAVCPSSLPFERLITLSWSLSARTTCLSWKSASKVPKQKNHDHDHFLFFLVMLCHIPTDHNTHSRDLSSLGPAVFNNLPAAWGQFDWGILWWIVRPHVH